MSFLMMCRGTGDTPRIYLVLRPPHTTHKTQPEDIANFVAFKNMLEKNKAALFLQRSLGLGGHKGPRGVFMTDLNTVSASAWLHAFDKKTNLNGWRRAGLVPFTRRPMWDLIAEEQRKKSALVKDGSVNFDFSTKKLEDLLMSDTNHGEDNATYDENGNPRPKTLRCAVTRIAVTRIAT